LTAIPREINPTRFTGDRGSMGGSIALTVRFSDGHEWRDATWTNVLPEGLWASEFYGPKKSEKHVRQWLSQVDDNRNRNPGIRSLWGDWNLLAPLEYGIVVIDYKTNEFASFNGYSSPDKSETFSFPPRLKKYLAMHDAGLITSYMNIGKLGRNIGSPKPMTTKQIEKHVAACRDLLKNNPYDEDSDFVPMLQPVNPVVHIKYKLPFDNVLIGMEGDMEECLKWVNSRFKLSKEENKEWKEWVERYCE